MTVHDQAVAALFAGALIAFLVLQFLSAPYGRHVRAGWGPSVGQRAGWIGMEIPTLLVFLPVYSRGAHAGEVVPLLMCALWAVHYVHRTLVFPFRIRRSTKRTPLVIVGLAFAFQVVNSWVNASQVSELGQYPSSWLSDPRFIAGIGLFLVGQGINHHADHILLNLRKPGETGYRIPRGGLYGWVTCPNYLGEIVIWLGWAVATWSTAGLAFFAFTCANLVPRAAEHHRWYHQTFEDYPKERKALVPYIW